MNWNFSKLQNEGQSDCENGALEAIGEHTIFIQQFKKNDKENQSNFHIVYCVIV